MSEKLIFDYYYGKEAEQFAFYRIPRMLIKDDRFSGLSSDAKILYGLMIDRMSISIRNEWQDENDRTYIIYTIEQIMEDLNCGKNKAIKVISELDSSGGIGLVERVRRGLGKPDIIYVKNFVGFERIQDENDTEIKEDANGSEEKKQPANPQKHTEVSKVNFKRFENQTCGSFKSKLQEVSKVNFKKSENETSGSSKSKLQEVSNLNFKKSEKQTSGGCNNKLPEVSKEDTIKNNRNQTDRNNTDIIQNKVSEQVSIIPSFGKKPAKIQTENDGMMERITATRKMIRDNIAYSDLLMSYPYERAKIDELVEIMVDACTSESRTLRIGKEDKPQVLVQSRFEKYDYSMMEYVLSCLKDNTTKVRNIKNYLLTTLYNAPLTIDNYYSVQVSHDMYGTGLSIETNREQEVQT